MEKNTGKCERIKGDLRCGFGKLNPLKEALGIEVADEI